MTFIDLFAGIGGFRLGLESAGFKCVFTSEIDKFAQKTYSHVFGNNNLYGDIRSIPAKSIPDFDILCGGFPCQPFSLAGHQLGFNDSRGTLFFEIARILKEKKPKVVFLENVKNLKSHDQGKTWKVIENTLINLGYHVFSKIIDAKLLVPQHRERMYIVCFKDDVKYQFPDIKEKQLSLKDILEPIVDSKYTLSDKLWNKYSNNT